MERLRTAVVPTVVVVLGAYGFAYAATGSPNPVDLVSHHSTDVSPKTSDAPETSEAPDPTDAPDPSEAPETPEASHTPKASHGPERSTVGCPDGFSGNHGQFVSQSDDHHAAAQSDCGKPVNTEPATSPSSSDNPSKVEHGYDKSPEPSESPDPDSTGDQHSNDHQGNDSHGSD